MKPADTTKRKATTAKTMIRINMAP